MAITNPGGLTTDLVLIRTKNDHIYIGHNNGTFDLVVKKYGLDAMYRIASPKLSPPIHEDLFGGVDTLGPTAAKIALGFSLEDVGCSSGKCA